jgi:hypothetical protein
MHEGLPGLAAFGAWSLFFYKKVIRPSFLFLMLALAELPGMMFRTWPTGTVQSEASTFSSIDMNNKSMQIPFFRLIL